MLAQQEHLLKILFILIWVLVFVHLSAEHFFLYWTYRWFDILTHFIGGVWIGLASLWFWYFSGIFHKMHLPSGRAVMVALVAGLVVGLLWEVYEYGLWEFSGKSLPSNYVPDSLLDIVIDVVGAVGGYGVFHFFIRKVEYSEEES